MKEFQTKCHQNRIKAPEFRILGREGGREGVFQTFFSLKYKKQIYEETFLFFL